MRISWTFCVPLTYTTKAYFLFHQTAEEIFIQAPRMGNRRRHKKGVLRHNIWSPSRILEKEIPESYFSLVTLLLIDCGLFADHISEICVCTTCLTRKVRKRGLTFARFQMPIMLQVFKTIPKNGTDHILVNRKKCIKMDLIFKRWSSTFCSKWKISSRLSFFVPYAYYDSLLRQMLK